jgi:hypothetical protein
VKCKAKKSKYHLYLRTWFELWFKYGGTLLELMYFLIQ